MCGRLQSSRLRESLTGVNRNIKAIVPTRLTDLIMPDKEGLEFIRELRRDEPTVGIIAMSGGGRGNKYSYLGPAKLLGADAALAKPFSKDEILATIESVLGERRQGS